MKNILIMITVLLLSCNKEEKEKQIYGNWIVTEVYTRANINQNWKRVYYNDGLKVKITKDSWKGIIGGKCYSENGIITQEIESDYTHTYNYNKSTDEIQLNQHYKGFWTKKYLLIKD